MSTPNLVAEARVELGNIIGEAFVGGEGDGGVARVKGEEFGAEFGKVDFLGVGAAVGVCE